MLLVVEELAVAQQVVMELLLIVMVVVPLLVVGLCKELELCRGVRHLARESPGFLLGYYEVEMAAEVDGKDSMISIGKGSLVGY